MQKVFVEDGFSLPELKECPITHFPLWWGKEGTGVKK